MSDQLFEVAFFGKDSEDASLDEVKAKDARMFNADDAKQAQLFSGKRVVIKKNIDRATAAKYETALNRAGAQCEVAPMGGDSAAQPAIRSGLSDWHERRSVSARSSSPRLRPDGP